MPSAIVARPATIRVRSARPRFMRRRPRSVDLQVPDADVGVDDAARGAPAPRRRRRARGCRCPRSTRSGSVGRADADLARRVDDARRRRDAHAAPRPCRARTLTSVGPRGSAKPRRSRSMWPTPSRYSGCRSATRGRPVLALAHAAAEVDVGGGDDGERQDEHDDREDEPSRPAEQAGGDQRRARRRSRSRRSAAPPPIAAIRPMPVAAPSAATSASRASVARAIARAGSSRTLPPKPR